MRAGREKDACASLSRALLNHARASGRRTAVIDSRSSPWSSALFTGSRVSITVTGELGGWLDSLPEADLPVRDHHVAELVVASRKGPTAVLDALLIEDA